MHFLLVNQNPAVSRLITLSVKKLGSKIFETSSFEDFPLESYDMVFVDNELYDEIAIDNMIESGFSRHFIYIASKGEDMPTNMNFVLQKPFLPTDFIDLVAKIELEDSEESLESITDDIEISNETSIDLEDEDSAMDLDDVELETIQGIDLNEDFELENDEIEEPSGEPEESQESEESLDFEDELESILDSEDIDEVKQLLDDDDNNSNNSQLDNKDSNEDFSLDELEGDKEEELDKIAQDGEFDEDFSLDFLEDDKKEETGEAVEDEKVEDEIGVVADTSLESQESLEHMISSLDDLDESVILEAFGKEVVACSSDGKATVKKEEVEKEIEKKVSQSVMEALEESSIKEALKGMRVNVSVTFEEDEK